jgi:hypothetical protein
MLKSLPVRLVSCWDFDWAVNYSTARPQSGQVLAVVRLLDTQLLEMVFSH